MTTARERYEQKTKVVTFRVSLEVYDELEQIKGKGGFSYSDLIKMGAGIAQEEIKDKLAKVSGLEHRLAELKASVGEEQRRLSEYLNEERRRRLEELDTEMKAFKLFDRGWRVEEASYELAIPQTEVLHYFEEWAEERKDKRAIERELIRECLKEHINSLKQQRLWGNLLPSTPKERLEEVEKQIAYCQHLLSAPSRINKKWREFLIAEYSARIRLAKAKRALNNTA